MLIGMIEVGRWRDSKSKDKLLMSSDLQDRNFVESLEKTDFVLCLKDP